jgi:hypothetical protein
MLLLLFASILSLSILVVDYILLVRMVWVVEDEVWVYEFCMIRDADPWRVGLDICEPPCGVDESNI